MVVANVNSTHVPEAILGYYVKLAAAFKLDLFVGVMFEDFSSIEKHRCESQLMC